MYNTFFYTIVEPIVSYIGYHVRTDENRMVAFSIFCCLCADMIILPVVIGMNMVEHIDTKFS